MLFNKPTLKLIILLFVAIGVGFLGGFFVTTKGWLVNQPVKLNHTQIKYLHSKHVGVTYKLYISLPKDYQTTKTAYHVVYLLDADYSFALAHNIVEHLSDRNNLAPMILVGIAYAGPPAYKLNRTRDYTPTFVPTGGYGEKYQRHSGGAPKFKQFLQDELIPYLAKHYRVTENRTLVGHSFGGLFSTWVALTSPTLFTNYLIVSPSLWYDQHSVVTLLNKYLASQHSLPANLYLSIGSLENKGDYKMVDDLTYFSQQLEKADLAKLKHQLTIFTDETHNTVYPAALTHGLLYLKQYT